MTKTGLTQIFPRLGIQRRRILEKETGEKGFRWEGEERQMESRMGIDGNNTVKVRGKRGSPEFSFAKIHFWENVESYRASQPK